MLNSGYLCKNKYGKYFLVKYFVIIFCVPRWIFIQKNGIKIHYKCLIIN